MDVQVKNEGARRNQSCGSSPRSLEILTKNAMGGDFSGNPSRTPNPISILLSKAIAVEDGFNITLFYTKSAFIPSDFDTSMYVARFTICRSEHKKVIH